MLPKQIRVLTLHGGENKETTLYRLQKGKKEVECQKTNSLGIRDLGGHITVTFVTMCNLDK